MTRPARILSLLLLLALTACGPAAVQQRRHAQAGIVVTEIVGEAHQLVLEARHAALVTAGMHARIGGADERGVAAAVALAGDAFDATPMVRAFDALLAADQAYLLAVTAWTADDHKQIHVAAALLAVLVAYQRLREALPADTPLPPLPRAVTDLIGGGGS